VKLSKQNEFPLFHEVPAPVELRENRGTQGLRAVFFRVLNCLANLLVQRADAFRQTALDVFFRAAVFHRLHCFAHMRFGFLDAFIVTRGLDCTPRFPYSSLHRLRNLPLEFFRLRMLARDLKCALELLAQFAQFFARDRTLVVVVVRS